MYGNKNTKKGRREETKSDRNSTERSNSELFNDGDEYKDNGEVELQEMQNVIEGRLMELKRCVSGQRIDEVKSNYELRAEMAKNRMNFYKAEYCTIIDAICVKLITQEVSMELYWKSQDGYHYASHEIEGYVATYRVKRSTTFKDIYEAACELWDLNERKYTLTDEYFNDLSLYYETVTNFFRGYDPMNPKSQAMVYIVEDDGMTKENNKLLKDSNLHLRKGASNDPATIKKINKLMKGLKQDKKIIRSDPEKLSNNFWILVCLFLLFVISVVSFITHFHIKPAYWYANINEQFFNKPYTVTKTSVSGVQTTTSTKFMNIETTEDIDDYILEYFKPKFLSASTSDSPAFLNNKKILYGPYRIHTLNVQEISCANGVDISAYNGTQNGVDYVLQCLKYDRSLSSSLNKKNLTSTQAGTYRSANEAKLDYKISGEYHDYTGDGYTWDVYPTKINQSQFQTDYNTLREAGFIGEDTVGIIISCIIYSKDLNMWAYNLAFLEKNLQGVIYTHFPNSIVFKPNYKFESQIDIIFFVVDVLKVTTFFCVCIYIICWEFYLWKFKSKRTLLKFVWTVILQLLGISITICYCVFHFYSGPEGKELLNIAAERNFDTYKDVWKTATYYKLALKFEAILVIILALVLLRFLRIIPKFHFFFQVIKDSMRIFAPKALLLIILLICYSIIASQIWNTVYYGFKDIGNSMIYILLLFELSTGQQDYDLYDNFNFGHEKLFGMILIIMIVTTVLYLTITTAIVVKSFDRHLVYLEHTVENEKPPHYMVKWFKAAKLDKIFCVGKCRRNRQEDYELNSQDEANLEMIRNIGTRNI